MPQQIESSYKCNIQRLPCFEKVGLWPGCFEEEVLFALHTHYLFMGEFSYPGSS